MNPQTKYIIEDTIQNFVTAITHNPPQMVAMFINCNLRTTHASFRITIMVSTVTFSLSCLVLAEGTHGCPLIQKI
jgi:hypothetical protein